MYVPTLSFTVSPCDAIITRTFKRCTASTDGLLSEPYFFSCAVSSDPPLCPLLIFHEKKKNSFSWTLGAEGYQSNRCASVKEAAAAAAGLGDVGEGEKLSMNPTTYPVQAADRTEEKFPISTSCPLLYRPFKALV